MLLVDILTKAKNTIGVKTNLTVNTGNKSWTVSPTSPHLVSTQIQQLQQTRELNLKISVTQSDKSPVPVKLNIRNTTFPPNNCHLKCCYPISGCSNEHLNPILVEKPRVH